MLTIFCILFFLYLVIGEPYIRHNGRKKFFANWKNIPNARCRLYQKDFIRNCSIGVVVLLAIWVFNIPMGKMGFRPVNIDILKTYSAFIQILIVLIFGWFFFYYYYFVTIGVRLNPMFRPYLIDKVKAVASSAPTNFSEYCWWSMNSFAAFFEELVYRGFTFFSIPYLIPGIPLTVVAIIAILLEAVRYAPRLAAIQYVATRGFVFTLAYVVFDSLYIPIFLHITYSLRIMAVPFKWVQVEQK